MRRLIFIEPERLEWDEAPDPALQSDREAIMLADVAAVASLIAEGEPPPWLAGGLASVAGRIKLFHRSDSRLPERAAMRQRLGAIKKAADLLIREFGDVAMRSFLLGAVAQAMPLDPRALAAQEGLQDISNRAGKALRAISTQGGKHRAQPLQRGEAAIYVGARELCAVATAEAWRLCRGSYPGPDNSGAQKAAAALWLAATGRHDSGWRNWLMAAKRLRDAPDDDPRRALVCEIRVTLTSAKNTAASNAL